MFDAMVTTMPPSAPGSLSGQVYVDIVAYVLERNQIPAGDVELQPDAAALRSIIIAAMSADQAD